MTTPELVERDLVLDELSDALAAASRGHGRMVLLEGDAGVGKTAVAAAVAARASSGVQRLVGSCDPLTTPQSLGPLLDMVEQSPRLASAARGTRHELFSALLRELSARQTLAIIEDVHWADAATADLLVHLGRRVTGTRALVLVTLRAQDLASDHPARIAIDGLATQRGVVRRTLEPLSVSGVARLVGGRAIDVEQLHARTGGNPFFVTEVLAAPGWAVPPTVADAVRARARRLPVAARAVLDTAAVEAASASLQHLIALGHAPADVDAAIASGMLVHAAGRVGFRHELARLGVLGDLAPAARAERHRAWLRLLEHAAQHEADAARFAAHARGAADRAATVVWSRRAAAYAAGHGTHREAASHLEAALAAGDALEPAERATLLSALAAEHSLIDRRGDAVAASEAALRLRMQLGDHEATLVARAELARAKWGLGDGAVARALMAEAVAEADRLASPAMSPTTARAVAFVHAWAGYLAMLARDDAAARRWATSAVRIARAHRLDDVLVVALNALGSTMIVGGHDLAGVQRLEEARELASALGAEGAEADALVNLGSALGEVREYALAGPCLERANAFAQARDLDAAAHYVTAWLARVRFEQGHWGEAEALLTALDLEHQGSPISAIVGLTVLGGLRCRRGEPVGDALERAWQLAQRTGDLQRLWPVVAARAEAVWLLGAAAPDPSLLGDLGAALAMAEERGLEWARDELRLWLARLDAGGASCERAARRDGGTAFALALAGSHATAAEAWRALGCPYEQAEALAEAGDEASLRHALALLQQLGGVPLAARARRRLRAQGATAVPLGPRPAARTHPSGLTARQLDVLELVAAGCTDRQIAERLFLSAKTVGHHVSGILAALGVDGRTAATRLAVERAWVGDDRSAKMGNPPQAGAHAAP